MQKQTQLNVGGFAFIIVAVFGTLSCAKNADDPNKPAVVKGPPVVLPSDTAKVDSTQLTKDRIEVARSQTRGQYALLVAAAGFGDRRTVAGIYAPEMVLKTPDSVYNGQAAAVAAIISLVHRNSIIEIRRVSEVMRLLPNDVVADSGSYVMVGRRDGGTGIVERGVYSATWKRQENGAKWTMLSDRLIPGTNAKPAPKSTPKTTSKKPTKPGL